MTPDQNRRLALALAAREVASLAKSGNGPMYCDDDVLAAAGLSDTEADALFDKEHPAFEAFNAELSRLAGRLMSEVQGAEAAPSVEQLRAQASVVGHAAAPFAQAAAEAARPSPDKEPVGDKLEFDGAVQEILPNKMYRVKADNGLGVLATISRRMLQYYIAIRPGDRVTVEVSPYDPSRGRITYRHK